MLARRREQVGLIAGLLVLNALLVWDLHRLWKGYQSRIEWVHAGAAQRPAAPPVSPQSHEAETQAFVEISSRNLFSPQRTSWKPADEEAKAPEPPLLFGTMNLGEGWFALMAPGGQSAAVSKRVLPGEEIGGYKLVSIAGAQVVVEWGERKITLDVSESARRVPRVIDKTASVGSTAPAPASRAPTGFAATGGVPTVASSSSSTSTSGARQGFGPAGFNAPPGASADAPAGTTIAGKRKVVNKTPFGDEVFWVDDTHPTNAAGTEKPQ